MTSTVTATTGTGPTPELPKVLSPSRLSDYKKCPKAFHFKSVLRVPTKPTEAQVKGTVVHDVLEHLFGLPAQERTVAAALAQLPVSIDAVWNRAEYAELRTQTDMDAHVEACTTLIENYFTIENPTRFTPDAMEQKVFGEIGGHRVMGVIDRLDTVVREDGTEVYISDYKTGKKPKPQYENEAFFAMGLYAVMLEDSGTRPSHLRLVYLSQNGRDAIIRRPVTEQSLHQSRRQTEQLIDGIRRAHSVDEWPTQTGPLCNWCDYQSICPAFNGPSDDGAPMRLNPW